MELMKSVARAIMPTSRSMTNQAGELWRTPLLISFPTRRSA